MVSISILRVSVAFVALFARSALAAPTGTVLTPGGYLPAANVHAVPDGGQVRHVNDEIHLIDKDGKVLHVAKHDTSKVISHSAKNSSVVPFATGWVAYADWYRTSDPINYFVTTWAVPPAPSAYNGQTVFLFNSIEPASGTAILQPVLQYGPSSAGGGEYWSVATWYVTGSSAYFTSLVTVSVAQVLQGLIELTALSGSAYTYVSGFTNVAGSSGLQLSNSPELVWATETLEIYNVASPAYLPPGATVFSGIGITTTTGVPAVTWATTSDPNDGISTVVNVQGATGAEVTITY